MAFLQKPDETIHFTNNMSIEIFYRNTQTYSKCKSYDAKAMSQGYVWHQILVEHKGKIKGIERKREILDALFDVVKGEEFYPIAYRFGSKEDRFLVRQCPGAFDKLFAQNLRIQLSNGTFISLQVQLNVGDFKFGQISPATKIEEALAMLYERMDVDHGQDGILDLSKFGLCKQLSDIVVNLGNRAVFERICELIYRNDEKFRHVNGLILSQNGITSVEPLKVFNGVSFSLIDLRENELNSPTRLCRDLNAIKADELLLAGNPITKLQTYPDCLTPILKNFLRIDGLNVENLSKDYTPMDYEVDVECDGFRIDWTNKADLQKFQNSTDWHAIMIPDTEQTFTKEEIFDYFFITVSPEMTEIYPCYYKYSCGEHQFLVRNCHDQLQHLVENCNLEIKIPIQIQPPPSSETDMSSIVLIEKTLVYYLRMNISEFKMGQIDPMECIEKALTRRFSAMDRFLNLDSFHDTEGLENIVINLSSTKILCRVLTQASRKYLSSCVELCLSNNKILNANFPKVLSLMSNLKSIDLGNNWIHDLNDIKELENIGIKSLRLDGNPLCAKYTFAGEYIKAVKQYFPELQKLDSIDITSKGYLNTQKNFLCDVKGYDFVEQFVTRYFKIFDSADRGYLKDLYHSDALFTMTSNYVAGKMTTHSFKRLLRYTEPSRNIRKMYDYSRAFASVHAGKNEIIGLFMSLPNMEHDMLGFTTDTTIFSDKMIVITVSGVFMDLAPNITDTDLLMAFTRTFVLTPVERNQGILQCATSYKIVNEQLSIFNPTSLQVKNAFKYMKTESSQKRDEITVVDKEALLVMLQEITNLKSVWCTRCLEEAEWDFQLALKIFMNLCDKNEVPETAFFLK